MRRFDLRTILTATTGRLLTKPKGNYDNGIGDLYELLGWMTNDSPFTHQLGRFIKECKPWLLRWYPELEKAGSPENLGRLDTLLADAGARGEGAAVAVQMWLDWIQEPGTCGLKGEYVVSRIPADDHTTKHPYDELVEMRGSDEGVVIVGVPESTEQGASDAAA